MAGLAGRKCRQCGAFCDVSMRKGDRPDQRLGIVRLDVTSLELDLPCPQEVAR
jgi:hypothetical protein